MRSVGRLLQAVRAQLHAACGWIAYRLGLRTASRRHYERVLLLRGADFAAYVHLGRIAFDVGDYAGWRREFEHARRADPRRFERLRHPLELFEPRIAGSDFDRAGSFDAGFDETTARATWRALRPFGGHRSNAGRSELPLESGLDALLPGCDARADTSAERPKGGDSTHREDAEARADATPSRDDCGSAAERRRFRELGPIAATELSRCDLDELLRRLSG